MRLQSLTFLHGECDIRLEVWFSVAVLAERTTPLFIYLFLLSQIECPTALLEVGRPPTLCMLLELYQLVLFLFKSCF